MRSRRRSFRLAAAVGLAFALPALAQDDLAPAELAKMRTTAKAVTDRFLSTYDPAIVKLYGDELARTQK